MGKSNVTIQYQCKLYEMGTNKEITDCEKILDVSMYLILADRDQPLSATTAPNHCAIIPMPKRGYLMVQSHIWQSSYFTTDSILPTIVQKNTNTPTVPKYTFSVQIQAVDCIYSDAKLNCVLNILTPILAVQLVDASNTFETTYSMSKEKSDQYGLPMGDYRAVFYGGIDII